MEIFIISLVSAAVSLLTFFSGFGLGTILTPVMVIFFPVEIAITSAAVVHFLNNIFKTTLVGRQIEWKVAIKFGVPAVVGAFLGAELLIMFSKTQPLYTYTISGKLFSIETIKLVISGLMIIFALFDIIPGLKKIQFRENKLYAGGLLSGFFGGLSGNQGALRSAFLLRTGLTKEQFIATGILIAIFVDTTRLSVYFTRLSLINLQETSTLLVASVLSAFAGAYIGSKLLRKVTIRFVEWTVAIMIIALALALGTGLL